MKGIDKSAMSERRMMYIKHFLGSTQIHTMSTQYPNLNACIPQSRIALASIATQKSIYLGSSRRQHAMAIGIGGHRHPR